MAIYDEPGRGRKPCPACKKYVGVRCSICESCGQQFVATKPKAPKSPKVKKTPVPPKAYDEGGPGRKQCECGKYYGSRGSKCPACGSSVVAPKVAQNKPAKVYDEGGPGRKQCECGKYYGARVRKCPACGSGRVAEKKKKQKVFEAYDEGGPGRKECRCGKFYGNRLTECPACGAAYEKKQVIKTYDTPGSRRKRCPECEVYVSTKAPKCVCGYEFPEDAPAETVSTSVWPPSKSDIENSEFKHLCGCPFTMIVTPAGICPVKLHNTDYESVQKWVGKIMDIGHVQQVHYAPSALRYWLRSMDAEEALENLAMVLESSRTGESLESEEEGFLEEILA